MRIFSKILLLFALFISTYCHKTKGLVLQMPPDTVQGSTANYGYCSTGLYYSEREPVFNSWCAINCNPDCDLTANNGYPYCIIRNRGCAPSDPLKICNCFNGYDPSETHKKCYPKSTYQAVVGQGIWCVNNCCPDCDACKTYCDCSDQAYRVPLFAPGLNQEYELGIQWEPYNSDQITYQ